MEADVLSDLLRAVRLHGAAYIDFNASPPWLSGAPETARSAEILMPEAEHVIQFHILARGHCWMRRPEAQPLLMTAGDIVVYPHGDPHIMASSAELTYASGIDYTQGLTYLRRAKEQPLPLLVEANPGKEPDVTLVCGFLGCDLRPFNPLIAALPREIHVRRADAGAEDWLATLLNVIMSESRNRRSGGQNVIARVSELMLVEVIRRHLKSMPAEQTGWLAGLRDRQVGKALALIHGEPERPWTLADLGERVALSRSAFADRFTRLVGISPMQYLVRWRMQLASELLGSSNLSLAAIAQRVGYESDTAFSRAFRRMTGVPPASWRRDRDRSAPADSFSAQRGAPASRGTASAAAN